ncbi:hypothetical protein EVAR_7541_1 [Eumeta japonica]|uniref:Uncharacterized protein n=1 Tax=Eumeta variegata TaxID=151549 RepID=A0A4C1VQ59_EUMVA|nr:hypothetical protein EVAR_7541_1 [Eumeta japonica]
MHGRKLCIKCTLNASHQNDTDAISGERNDERNQQQHQPCSRILQGCGQFKMLYVGYGVETKVDIVVPQPRGDNNTLGEVGSVPYMKLEAMIRLELRAPSIEHSELFRN